MPFFTVTQPPPLSGFIHVLTNQIAVFSQQGTNLFIGTGRAANAKDVASIYNEALFHSVDLGGYVCMPTRSSEASSFGFARKWRKRDLVGLQ